MRDNHQVRFSLNLESLMERDSPVNPLVQMHQLRMISMEKQLASLSSLVHSALNQKSSTLERGGEGKDLESLRKEILGPGNLNTVGGSPTPGTRYGLPADIDNASDAGSVSRFSDTSFMSAQERDFYPQQQVADSNLRRQLFDVKAQVGDLQAELKHLQRMAQMNSQQSKELLRDTFDKIKTMLDARATDMAPLKSQLEAAQPLASNPTEDEFWRTRLLIDQELNRHKAGMGKVDHALADLEQQIEAIRVQVVNTNRKLRVSEVEQFTQSLTAVGRMAAHLKSQFPLLHSHLKAVMSAEMEKVVKEEKFLKEEGGHMDAALRRCKKLTNTMITMKKLALVQDPDADPSNLAPRVPPPPKHYRQPTANGRADGHVLDNLLVDLQTVTTHGYENNPRPPSRASSATPVANQPAGQALVNGNGHSNGRAPSYPRALQSAQLVQETMNGHSGSREGTPSSVSSEPSQTNPKPQPSQTKYATLDRQAGARQQQQQQHRRMDLAELKQQLHGLRPPAPLDRTSALDDRELGPGPNPNWQTANGGGPPGSQSAAAAAAAAARQASSNESVNSQDALHVNGFGAPAKPPPPPPPRNRQELLQQRHNEQMQRTGR